MQTLEQRVQQHAVIAGMLGAGRPINSYTAEGAAWVADACANAVNAGADLRDVATDVSMTMRRAGASRSEQVFAQLVVAEIEALVHRLSCDEARADAARAIREKFQWTEQPQAGGDMIHIVRLLKVAELQAFERSQAKAIYVTALLRAFGNQAKAFRAWATWSGAPRSRDAAAWRRHHARAQALAFAGLDVSREAAVSIRFRLEP
jgi:hypothetical protein